MVFLHNTNATVVDAGPDTMISVSRGGNDVFQGAGSDPSLVADLTGRLGGFGSASAVVSALTSDGIGGTLLSFGGSQGYVDFAGMAPSALQAAKFKIGWRATAVRSAPASGSHPGTVMGYESRSFASPPRATVQNMGENESRTPRRIR